MLFFQKGREMSEVDPQAKKDGPRLGRIDYAKRFAGLVLGFGALYLLIEALTYFHAPGIAFGIAAISGVGGLVALWLIFSWRRVRDIGKLWFVPRLFVMWFVMICAGSSGIGFLTAALFLILMPSTEARNERRAALKARRAKAA